MTEPGDLYPGQESPGGLVLWLRFLGDQMAGVLFALGIWPLRQRETRPEEPPGQR